ncbi:alpha/beta hydrolase [Reichenbachiella carrageenanivorans]|uniref:Alpha/beta hydrolase n=1 Tax=Reichenbachiella carrageenanivorans TaxID=2979869 RepID=A0ABY6D4I9_9BACT|nr:alpha/beta hydrolase [Reichenbachiella carrageenanivorans]UXX81023.1 alpha/beta hydrolase [Reichenbachiella carrageenanivorans]
MKSYIILTLCLLVVASKSFGQGTTLSLWEGKVPNQRVTDEQETRRQDDIFWVGNVQAPALDVYLPAPRAATGKAVIICPGGAYHHLAYDWEGTDIAKWFNSKGITAFVLKYRLPESKSLVERHKAPLQDAQRAMRLVRKNAKQWNIDPSQIGIMGFSAGGHLASTLGTHYDEVLSTPQDSIDALSARPDFMILVYPVITMQEAYTHTGSRDNLLGAKPDTSLLDEYSNELHVNANTPPTFIVHAMDDEPVPVMNSLLFYQALVSNGVMSEAHFYPEGGHGFALAIGKGYLQNWPNLLLDWIDSLK